MSGDGTGALTKTLLGIPAEERAGLVQRFYAEGAEAAVLDRETAMRIRRLLQMLDEYHRTHADLERRKQALRDAILDELNGLKRLALFFLGQAEQP